MTKQTTGLEKTLAEYIQSISLREPDILRQLREETAKLSMAQMQISPEQGQLMALLVQLMGAKKTLEIGVFTGYSALAVALALPIDGKMIACDISEEYTAIAKDFWTRAGVSEKIDVRIAPALETLEKLITEGEAESFDLAFIDADKRNYAANRRINPKVTHRHQGTHHQRRQPDSRRRAGQKAGQPRNRRSVQN